MTLDQQGSGGFQPARIGPPLLGGALIETQIVQEKRMSDYEPVSCDYHDELEAAAVSQKEVELEFDAQGVRQRERGKIKDVYSESGAEFVTFEADNGSLDVRLDQIISFRAIE
jgi:Rho-binding antiterminator